MDEYVPTVPFIRERPHVFSSRRVLDRGLMTYFKQREEEGETQMRTLSARSQRLRSLASSYMDLSPSERRRIPTVRDHNDFVHWPRHTWIYHLLNEDAFPHH